jgi:hypothetical protein
MAADLAISSQQMQLGWNVAMAVSNRLNCLGDLFAAHQAMVDRHHATRSSLKEAYFAGLSVGVERDARSRPKWSGSWKRLDLVRKRNSTNARKRIDYDPALGFELSVVDEVLKIATTAPTIPGARRFDSIGA